MQIKIDKNTTEYPCHIYIEHSHNHPIHALEAISFTSISPDVVSKVMSYFEQQLPPSLAYYEFIRNLRENSESELDFHLDKANRSKCPRRRDFNALYRKFCIEHFGGKNGNTMFECMEEKLSEFREKHVGTVIDYQLFDPQNNDPLIIAVLTPLMERVHQQVFSILITRPSLV